MAGLGTFVDIAKQWLAAGSATTDLAEVAGNKLAKLVAAMAHNIDLILTRRTGSIARVAQVAIRVATRPLTKTWKRTGWRLCAAEPRSFETGATALANVVLVVGDVAWGTFAGVTQQLALVLATFEPLVAGQRADVEPLVVAGINPTTRGGAAGIGALVAATRLVRLAQDVAHKLSAVALRTLSGAFLRPARARDVDDLTARGAGPRVAQFLAVVEAIWQLLGAHIGASGDWVEARRPGRRVRNQLDGQLPTRTSLQDPR